MNKCVLFLSRMCCFQIQERPQGAGGPAGCRPAGREQAGKCSCTSYVLRRKIMYEDVPSHSGQKISCTRINRHVLRIYEDILYLKNSYWDIRTYTELHGQKLYSVYTEIYFYCLTYCTYLLIHYLTYSAYWIWWHIVTYYAYCFAYCAYYSKYFLTYSAYWIDDIFCIFCIFINILFYILFCILWLLSYFSSYAYHRHIILYIILHIYCIL